VTTRIYRDKEFELFDEVYDPSEDSYLLVEAALAEVKAGDRVLEVGTGSGIVSLFLGDHSASVVATDISPLACANARRNGVAVVRADLYHGICGPFDLVIFNPPYLPTADEDRLGGWLDHAFDGGPTGRKVIARFLEGIGTILPPCGRVLTVFSSLTGIAEVEQMYRSHGFTVETVRTEKVPFEKLVVLKCVRRP
jgi:release factor glutamine methyltransferase